MLQNSSGFLALLPDELVVVAVPTTGTHQRLRGFDHSRLLAQTIAKKLNKPFKPALHRHGTTRQVGSTRQLRLKQLKGTFYVPSYKVDQVVGNSVLLLDDVMTTGATVEEAVRALKVAGAKRVYALVLAKR